MGSSYSIRAFGAFLYRFSNGVSLKCPNSFTLRSTGLLSRNLSSSSSSISSYASWVSSFEVQSISPVRKIWTFSPVCMGRRSSKIATRKGAQDAKKAKLYAKIGKEVVSAVKRGGPNPVSNMSLAAVIEKAKELDVPKEILERNIKRASEKGQEAYIEKFYEVYGFGGVGIIVEVLTDKVNRSVAAVREVVKDCGGKMADPGSIMFKFNRARVVNIKVTDADKDQLLAIALDAGADDVIEPPMYEDDTEEERSERYYKVVTSAENYAAILSKLREEGITFEPDNGFELLPVTPIEVDDEAMDLNKELMSNLLELDDVDAVYTDQK
uniref:Transcriptional regulatory protein n=1 Tax=Davidia involucrata TaxID=16924 RepID=A0A5B7BXG0_DAVIN